MLPQIIYTLIQFLANVLPPNKREENMKYLWK